MEQIETLRNLVNINHEYLDFDIEDCFIVPLDKFEMKKFALLLEKVKQVLSNDNLEFLTDLYLQSSEYSLVGLYNEIVTEIDESRSPIDQISDCFSVIVDLMAIREFLDKQNIGLEIHKSIKDFINQVYNEFSTWYYEEFSKVRLVLINDFRRYLKHNVSSDPLGIIYKDFNPDEFSENLVDELIHHLHTRPKEEIQDEKMRIILDEIKKDPTFYKLVLEEVKTRKSVQLFLDNHPEIIVLDTINKIDEELIFVDSISDDLNKHYPETASLVLNEATSKEIILGLLCGPLDAETRYSILKQNRDKLVKNEIYSEVFNLVVKKQYKELEDNIRELMLEWISLCDKKLVKSNKDQEKFYAKFQKKLLEKINSEGVI